MSNVVQQDQRDRRPHYFRTHYELVSRRDEQRRAIVFELIRRKALRTGGDFYNAALIMQHGTESKHYRQAIVLAKRAMNLRERRAAWLYAASTDRLLLHQGRKQKFGTQYQVHSLNSRRRLSLCPYDKRTSDATRLRFDVPPLRQALALTKKL